MNRQIVKSQRFHELVVKDVLTNTSQDADIFCLMLLLHGCDIALSTSVQTTEGGKGFAPITSRHVSEAVAFAFNDVPRNDPNYWYERWNGEWDPYRVLEAIPADLIQGLRSMRKALEGHRWIEKVTDEDWDLIETIDRPE